MECKRWLTSENQIEAHIGEDGQCYANATTEAIHRGIVLYPEGGHDTATLTTPVPDTLDGGKWSIVREESSKKIDDLIADMENHSNYNDQGSNHEKASHEDTQGYNIHGGHA